MIGMPTCGLHAIRMDPMSDGLDHSADVGVAELLLLTIAGRVPFELRTVWIPSPIERPAVGIAER